MFKAYFLVFFSELMQSASSVTLIKFIAYVTLKSKVFPIIHMQIHIVQEFDDINVLYMHHQFFFGLVIIMLMKSDPDSVRNNIFADACAVRNISVDVNAVNIFLLLTLTSSIYFVDAHITAITPR